MSIVIHCDYCGKKIEAADNAAGKWGKCPSCHNKLYIPDLTSGEELSLAPVDENDETRKKRLMLETYKVAQDILLERQVPEDQTHPRPTPIQAQEVSDKELTKNIIIYLRLMAESNLEQARQLLGSITPFGQQAIKIIDQIALSDIPEPGLENVPQQLLAGLIRNLRSEIT